MDEYLEFIQNFLGITGLDLNFYKRPQMERRLTAVRERYGYTDFKSFGKALKTDAKLLTEVMDKVTINVTEFFRNPERWIALESFLNEMRSLGPLKIWSAACSTGEEPYTVAMMMEARVKKPYDIIATDIDQKAISRAETGEYHENQMRSLPDEYKRFFHANANSWVISSDMRSHVRFQTHNLLTDPYPNALDVIICRNVLIYFTESGKQRIIAGFAQALRTNGLLFVGSTEQFLDVGQYGLRLIAPFIYRKVGN